MKTDRATKPELLEGPQAWERFRAAAKALMTTPKSVLPPSPFGKRKREANKRKAKPEPA